MWIALYPPGVNRPVSDQPEFRDPLCQFLIGIPAGKIIALTGRYMIGKSDHLTVGSPDCTYAAATVRMKVQRIAGGIAAAAGTAAVLFRDRRCRWNRRGCRDCRCRRCRRCCRGRRCRRGRRILRYHLSCRNSDTTALTIGVPRIAIRAGSGLNSAAHLGAARVVIWIQLPISRAADRTHRLIFAGGCSAEVIFPDILCLTAGTFLPVPGFIMLLHTEIMTQRIHRF